MFSIGDNFDSYKRIYSYSFLCTICTYCDFNKYFMNKQPVDEYLDALIKEMQVNNNEQLQTMYVGGGTPTALNCNLKIT